MSEATVVEFSTDVGHIKSLDENLSPSRNSQCHMFERQFCDLMKFYVAKRSQRLSEEMHGV